MAAWLIGCFFLSVYHKKKNTVNGDLRKSQKLRLFLVKLTKHSSIYNLNKKLKNKIFNQNDCDLILFDSSLYKIGFL